jgi:hypothetical protein
MRFLDALEQPQPTVACAPGAASGDTGMLRNPRDFVYDSERSGRFVIGGI